jgi:hypothetical protein
MGHAIFERVRLFGTRSADYIRASGHNGCIATEVTLQATTEAEYMTAPARFADSQIPLAPRAPSIHDPQRNWSVHRSSPGLLRDHLFLRLVGACEHGRRNGEAERFVAARLKMMRWLNSIFAARRSECSERRYWQMKLVGSFHCEHSIGYHLT